MKTSNASVIPGDCREVMLGMPEASIDTILCDPPYGLSFMGKGWDHGVPSVEFWQAALRVAKPGALLLAFGGTRTHHRLMCAIEDAGWELRDCLMWIYGTGFPKSHDISKAVDKRLGAKRTKIVREGVGYATAADGNVYAHGLNAGFKPREIRAPASSEAAKWNGYGTALKPAWEPIILAMKPVDGTFADNALKHGIAGLNIDGCRVPLNGDRPKGSGNGSAQSKFSQVRNSSGNGGNETPEKGRWPANVLLDEDSAAMLDVQSGVRRSGAMKTSHKRSSPRLGQNAYGEDTGYANGAAYDRERKPSSGGASRFFYCAKASRKERGEFNTHPTVKPLDLLRYLVRLTTPPGDAGDSIVLDPFCGSGSTLLAAVAEGRKAIGIELESEYCAIAARRLAEASLDGR